MFKLKLNLQRFALPGEEIITDDDDFQGLPDDLADFEDMDEFGNVIQGQNQDGQGTDSGQGQDGQGQGTDDGQGQPQDGEGQGQPQDGQPQDGQKQQSAEENARFAAMRREREFQERLEREVQARLAQIQQNSPEAQLARMLSQHYNMPIEQLVPALQQMTLQQQAEATGIPIQTLQEIQRLQQTVQQAQQQVAQVEQQKMQLEYQQWQAQKDAERAQVKQIYPFLTDQDIDAAMVHMLQNVKTTDFDLRQAVRFVHGDKIEEGLRRQAEQEALAKVGGRKNPLPRQGATSSNSADGLDDTELYIAARLGVKPEDYAKYRDPQ